MVLELVGAILEKFWLVPFVILILFILAEEYTRMKRYNDQIHLIQQKKIRHTKSSSGGMECEITIKEFIKEKESDEVLRLYYVDYPIIQRCLASLHVKKYPLYIALATILLLVQYMLSSISTKLVSTEQVKNMEILLSYFGFWFCFVFGLYLWFNRCVPIRTFCDKLKQRD